MLYGAYQAQLDVMAPAKSVANFVAGAMGRLPGPLRERPRRALDVGRQRDGGPDRAHPPSTAVRHRHA